MATFPIPEELRLGNAIMLGAKQTCPECTMDVRFINTWHDPTAGARRRGLAVRRGRPGRVHRCGHAGRRRRSRRRRASGASPTTTPAPAQLDACLTAPYWIWGPEYARIAEQVKAGTYTAGYEYFDADAGAMGLFGFMEGETPQPGIADLPEEDVQLVKDTLAAMLAGEFDRFDVFAGPITDNQGNVVLAEGETLEQTDLDQFPHERRRRTATELHVLVGGRHRAPPCPPSHSAGHRTPRGPGRPPRLPFRGP